MTLDRKQLYTLIEEKHGKKICEMAKESINSLVKRREFASFHFNEYRKILDSKDTISKKIDLIFDDYADNLKIEANVIACMQNMHSAFDILGHVIYYAFNLGASEKTKILENKIYIKSIRGKLEDEQLKNLLKALIEHDDYKYLEAIVNHSKHRYLINHDLTIAGNTATYFFDSFKYGEKYYEKCVVNDFIEREYNREVRLIMQIENELINILEAVV
ncbi:hypothetical protein CVO_04115 [Sulfurimonas sp. CVO]|uniref:hypothetical protein n=1 Tax=Sulfurimonas sp. CVO TaxID=2283483 RepID=UPI00132EDC4C|nr:hypothetical protein [Sulfurimonas sp. CVO]QHG91075.1 hypothetical protein CVO_04115 [Sulfurimonas sp. CVO]